MEIFQTNSNKNNLTIQQSLHLQKHLMILSLDIGALQELTKEMFDDNPLIDSYSFHQSLSPNIIESLKAISFEDSFFEFEPMVFSSRHYKGIAQDIFASLNEEGFLDTEDKNYLINRWDEQLHIVLDILQKHSGLGFANRCQFWIWQLQKKGKHPEVVELLTNFSAELIKGDFKRIFKKLDLDADTFENKYLKILRNLPLSPRQPSHRPSSKGLIDAHIIIQEDRQEIEITDPLPSYTLNSHLSLSDPNLKSFYKPHFTDLKLHIEGVKKRGETLKKVLSALIELQKEYLTAQMPHPRSIHPEELAKSLGMHQSTLARCVQNKTILCPHGLIKLKTLVTPQVSLEDKGGLLQKLKELICLEDKNAPYSDQKLLELLRAKGSSISRRTITKYRHQLKIPDARRRFFR